MSGTTHGNYKLLSSYPSDVELYENEKYAPDNGSDSSGTINDKLEKNKSSLWKSVCNLIVTLEGMGLLSLPYVVQQGGWPAVAALTIVPFICYYTGKILVECLYDVHKDNKVGKQV
jgi:vesicular inhibitory amino acid transporter